MPTFNCFQCLGVGLQRERGKFLKILNVSKNSWKVSKMFHLFETLVRGLFKPITQSNNNSFA